MSCFCCSGCVGLRWSVVAPPHLAQWPPTTDAPVPACLPRLDCIYILLSGFRSNAQWIVGKINLHN